MKTLLRISISVCLIITVTCISEEHQKLRDSRKKAVEECRKEKPEVSDDDFASVYRKESPKNEIQHCVIECVYEKMGMVKNGKLVYEEISKSFQAMLGHDPAMLSFVSNFGEECKNEVEQKYGSIPKCGVSDAFHSCMGRKKNGQ
ncbi:uncharacterized protein LOC135833262 [Planococcus citri]|uniref:uncharacterized protein LOC135833262 n=1 Tax=Planococcus citri TaxID=170843 RepID=UPI0031F9000C